MTLPVLWESVRNALAAEKARARTLQRVEEADFLPAALEIIERPVSPTLRHAGWLLLAGVAVAGLWLGFAPIDIVASASGKLVPAESVKLVQPAGAGVVHAILVRENQRVRAGQPLIELDPTISVAETVQARKALEAAELDAARESAVLGVLDGNGLVLHAPEGTSPQTVALQTELARAELTELRGARLSRDADRAAARSALAQSTVQVAKLTETLPLLDVQIDAYEELLAKGFASRLRVVELRRQRLGAARDRDIAIENVRKARDQLRSASGALEQTSANGRVQVLAELVKAQAEAKLRREDLTKAVERAGFQRLLSPVDGTVSLLGVHTVGGVVEAAKPVMAIVPLRGPLVAEIRIRNKDIGFVRVGQPVSLKIATYPFTRYGTVPGRIEGVSSDSTEDQKLGLVYTARIAMDRIMRQRDGGTALLNPGMQVTADIVTGRRTILEYLLGPIDAMRQSAARER